MAGQDITTLEEIVENLNEIQQRQDLVLERWRNQALELLSYHPKLRPLIKKLDDKFIELIESNDSLSNDFKTIIGILRKNRSQERNLGVRPGGYSTEKRHTQPLPSGQYQSRGYPSHQRVDSPTIQRLRQNYNAGIENPLRKNEFIQHYNPVRIGVANAMERRREPGIKPVFQTASDGDYYAVAVEGNTRFVVVPRFDLTFQESIYCPGAMGQVFDCPGYDSQLRYRRVKVVKPAFFEPDSTKQRWTFIEKGELNLGHGE